MKVFDEVFAEIETEREEVERKKARIDGKRRKLESFLTYCSPFCEDLESRIRKVFISCWGGPENRGYNLVIRGDQAVIKNVLEAKLGLEFIHLAKTDRGKGPNAERFALWDTDVRIYVYQSS